MGTLSDLLRPAFGRDSLRYAMLTVSLTSLWAAYHFWQVGRTVKEDALAIEHGNACFAKLGVSDLSVLDEHGVRCGRSTDSREHQP